jgi:hypothetical protein
MEVTIKLQYWQAVRLKSLIQLGKKELNSSGRSQLGIDGFTESDLDAVNKVLNLLKDTPEFAGMPK